MTENTLTGKSHEESSDRKLPLRRKERDICWSARDEYYGCLEKELVPLLQIDSRNKTLSIPGTVYII